MLIKKNLQTFCGTPLAHYTQRHIYIHVCVNKEWVFVPSSSIAKGFVYRSMWFCFVDKLFFFLFFFFLFIVFLQRDQVIMLFFFFFSFRNCSQVWIRCLSFFCFGLVVGLLQNILLPWICDFCAKKMVFGGATFILPWRPILSCIEF